METPEHGEWERQEHRVSEHVEDGADVEVLGLEGACSWWEGADLPIGLEAVCD